MTDSIAFDRAADYYDATRGFGEREEQAIGALATTLGKLDGPVLEVGVGTGRIALPLQQRGYDYYGVDLSMPMMNKLREKLAGGQRIPLVQGDITRLPFRDRCFAALVAVHIFHLVPNWRAALVEAKRVLRDGGMLVHAGSGPEVADTTTHAITGKWQELLLEAGYSTWATSSHQIAPQVSAALQELGARVETRTVLTWSNPRSPRQAYERLASRQWSRTWAVPDDIFARTIQQLHEWAVQEYGNRFDTPQDDAQEFNIMVAQF